MPSLSTDSIEIAYELRGPEAGAPLLMIMGLGSQLVRWTEKFLAELEGRGFRLILFDNRDVGLTTHFDDAGTPNLLEVLQARASGRDPGLPYGLDDMADDCVDLLDGIGVERAHVFGISMGGMIAQTLAARHPRRAATLTSVMSTTGNPELPPPDPDVAAKLIQPRAENREAFIAQSLESDRLIGSPVFPFEEEAYRERAGRAWDRCYDPAGVARQLAAVAAHGDRREALGTLELPSLVIHGSHDRLVPIEGGRDTAASIPGAEWIEIQGMAHDLPAPSHAPIADALVALTRRHD